MAARAMGSFRSRYWVSIKRPSRCHASVSRGLGSGRAGPWATLAARRKPTLVQDDVVVLNFIHRIPVALWAIGLVQHGSPDKTAFALLAVGRTLIDPPHLRATRSFT